MALKVWDSTGSLTGPELSPGGNKQHHISVALFSAVFPLFNCCILQQMRHCGLLFFAVFRLQTSGRTGLCAGIKHRALLKLPATELAADSVPTVIMKNMVTSGIFHFQGCQALSSAPHRWGRNKSTTSGLFEGCRACQVHPCSG